MQISLVLLALLQLGASLPQAAQMKDAGLSDSLTWLELSQFHFKPYLLSNICVECSKIQPGDAMFNCSIGFDWVDPNADGSRAHCDNGWQWDGKTTQPGASNTYNTIYVGCPYRGEVFQFLFQSMTNISYFGLELSHIFKDSNDFPEPTMANLFGLANVTLESSSSNETAIVYGIPGPVEAKIMGAVI
ncbi:hypothetical protein F5Y15DRAFT_422926 [Xylariaceae sp. FL0016]|nr:hypothetical protein F5Y15DRAFT_422926 [Xylariaceae sp. FL0016]